MPERIQLRRTKGWRMPPNTVKVDRSTDFGNPFPADVSGPADAVDRYRRWMTRHMSSAEMSGASRQDRWPDLSLVTVRAFAQQRFGDLRGKNLACWCKPGEPCHADVLLELANG